MEFGIGLMLGGDAPMASPGPWQALDDSNFSAFYIGDHPAMGTPDPWTFLAHVAARTQRIHIGTHVTVAPLHHPTRLACQVATVDVLSGGRARLGIGAGWTVGDFEPYGFPYRPLPERLDLMEEGLRILKLLWTQDGATHEGQFFKIAGAQLRPKPVQRPHPPLIVGANTSGRALRIAAAHADGINTWQLAPEQLQEMRGHMDQCCRAIGRDPASLRLTADVLLLKDGTREAAQALAEQFAAFARTGGRSARATQWHAGGVLHGDEEAVAEQVRRFRDAGVDELTVWVQRFEDFLWFSERVIPRFRGQA